MSAAEVNREDTKFLHRNQGCLLGYSGVKFGSVVIMALAPVATKFVVRRVKTLRNHIDWDDLVKMSEVIYGVFFFYSILENSTFYDVVCLLEDGARFSCVDNLCELPSSIGPESGTTCDLCLGHFNIGGLLMGVAIAVSSGSMVVLAVLLNEQPTPHVRWSCRFVHFVNALVWYCIGLIVKLYLCNCKWKLSVDLALSSFGPLSACLLALDMTVPVDIQLDTSSGLSDLAGGGSAAGVDSDVLAGSDAGAGARATPTHQSDDTVLLELPTRVHAQGAAPGHRHVPNRLRSAEGAGMDQSDDRGDDSAVAAASVGVC